MHDMLVVKTKEKIDRKQESRKLERQSKSRKFKQANDCVRGRAKFKSATYETVIFERPDLITYDTDSIINVYQITNNNKNTF